MTETMREPVAKVLYDEIRKHPDPLSWVTAEALARDAMEAMANGPTDEMIEHETYTSGQWSRRNYEAIFAAALLPS